MTFWDYLAGSGWRGFGAFWLCLAGLLTIDSILTTLFDSAGGKWRNHP